MVLTDSIHYKILKTLESLVKEVKALRKDLKK
jgi:hypothetical protein